MSNPMQLALYWCKQLSGLTNGIFDRTKFAKITRGAFSVRVIVVALSTFNSVHSAGATDKAPQMVIPGKFEVSSTGAATYSIPISVPPGTAGVIPAIELKYSSEDRDGVAGLGWTIGGLPTITRCPRTIAQDGVHGSVNFDANDRFCLDGKRLVLVNGSTYGAPGTQYATEVETFSKITASGTAGSGPSSFEVQTKSGEILYFGATPDSQAPLVPVPGSSTGQTGTVRAWAVNQISDTRGNYISIQYDNGAQDKVNGQIYPTTISYTGNSTTGLAAYNSVQFKYQSRTSQDTMPTYQAGSLLQSTILLADIKTYTGTSLVSDYHLTYTLNQSGATFDELDTITLCGADGKCLLPTIFSWPGHGDQLNLTPINNATMQGTYDCIPNTGCQRELWINRQISALDFNGDGVVDLLGGGSQWPGWGLSNAGCNPYDNSVTALSFIGNGDGSFTQVTLNQVFSWYNGTTWVPNSTDQVCQPFEGAAEFNIEGLTDFAISTNIDNYGPWGVLQNDGRVTSTSPGTLNELTSAASSDVNPPIMGDFDGNGLTDFLTRDPTTFDWVLDLFQPSGTFAPEVDLTQAGFQTHEFYAPSTPDIRRSADFDGDGCNDLLEAYNQYITITYFCRSPFTQVTYDASQWLSGWNTSPNVLNGSFLQVGDFNGDGKSDILLEFADFNIGCPPGNGCNVGTQGVVLLSTGTGFTAASYPLPGVTGNYVIGDWNGIGRDGVAAIQIDSTNQLSHIVYFSTPTGFIQAASISNTNPKDANPSGETSFQDEGATTGDWNSDGATDLWLQKPSGDVEYLFTPFSPQLISAISNGAATTNITYQRLNTNGTFYTKGTGSVYPTKDLDGPTYVVSRVDSDNGLGVCNPTSGANCDSATYAYSGERSDLSGHGFLGFASVSITDLNTHLIQLTNYLQTFPFTGMIASVTKTCPAKYCVSGSDVVLNSVANCYKVRLSDCSNPSVAPNAISLGTDRYFVVQRQTTASGNDVDGSSLPTTTSDYTYDCDGSGNPCGGGTPAAFGNVTQISATTAMPNGSDSSTKTTANTYADDSTDWLLGRLATSSVTSTVPNEPTLTRTTSYCYDLPNGCRDPSSKYPSGVLMTETMEPNATDATLTLETEYSYDAYGNKTQVSLVGCANPNIPALTCPVQQTRTTQTQYDTIHAQFAVTVTNPLGESETWGTATNPEYDLRFGTPLLHTDPNGLVSSWAYNSLGQLTSEQYPDLTSTSYLYQICTRIQGGTDAACPTNGAFTTTASHFAKDGTTQIAPTTHLSFDTLLRHIASDVQGFQGGNSYWCWIRSDTNYDAKGRILETDRPYYLGTGSGSGCATQSPAYTVNSYVIPGSGNTEDALGRVRTVTPPPAQNPPNTPAGGYKQYTYSGLTTSVLTNVAQLNGSGSWQSNQASKTTVRNARGLIASVTDEEQSTTNYLYDAFGDLAEITDPNGNVAQDFFDLRGRKTKTSDPDMGTWTYVYDSFGELYQRTDAKGQIAMFGYDLLGRPASRSEPDMVGTWTYGSNPTLHNVDKLSSVQCQKGTAGNACPSGTYTRNYAYDGLSRQTSLSISIAVPGGQNFPYSATTSYDPNTGKINTVKSFSGYNTTNQYDALGYLDEVIDTSANFVIWQGQQRDAELHAVEASLAGGALNEANSYDNNTGHLLNVCASAHSVQQGCQGDVANYSYGWDVWDNLLYRSDMLAGSGGMTENFCYDGLNRLVSASYSGYCQAAPEVAVNYDALGNIINKTDICQGSDGCMSYGNSAGPHALTGIKSTGCNGWDPGCEDNGIQSPTFSYDANGNVTCERATGQGNCDATAARFVMWTSFNMVSQINTTGTSQYNLLYDPEHDRAEQCIPTCASPTSTTLYLSDPVSGAYAERVSTNGTATWRTYIRADGQLAAERFVSGSTVNMDYFVDDNLGSPSVIYGLNSQNVYATLERDSYDAWGKMRTASNWSYDSGCGIPQSSLTSRHFTGHEELSAPAVCVINANARVYDPQVGRFLSPDDLVPDTYNLQSLNRYTYVDNMPLSATDPSGHCIPSGGLCDYDNPAKLDWKLQFVTPDSCFDCGVPASWNAQTTVVGQAQVTDQQGNNYNVPVYSNPAPETNSANPAIGALRGPDGNVVGICVGNCMRVLEDLEAALLKRNNEESAFGKFLGGENSPTQKHMQVAQVEERNGSLIIPEGFERDTDPSDPLYQWRNSINDEPTEREGRQAPSELPSNAGGKWPADDGFAGRTVWVTLPEGSTFDRYGGPDSEFAAPEGTPFEQRGLPPEYQIRPLYRYEVKRPIPGVQFGSTAEWGAGGGGFQFKLPETVQRLLTDKYIKEIPPP